MSTRIDQLRIGALPSVRKDALAPYDPGRAIVLVHDTVTAALGSELAEGIALQLLALHRPGQAELVLYEAVPSPLFAHVKRLYAQSAGSWGEQLLNARTCHDLLSRLTEQAHRRFALLASAHVSDIAAYNAAARRVEPIVYLLITAVDGLHGETHALQLLQGLCRNGPSVGIVPLLLCDRDAARHDTAAELKRKGMEAFWGRVTEDAFGLDLTREPAAPLNQPAALWSLFHRFGLVLGLHDTDRARWVQELVARAHETAEVGPHKDFLSVPIGREGGTVALFRLGDACDSYHALIGGATRSGKSTLLENLILRACETSTPEELRLWLFDFREGVEFHVFGGLAHLDTLHLDNEDRQGAIDAFSAFEAMMRQRAALFRQCDPPVSRLADYNRHAARPLPRCLLIVDEAQSLFADRETRPHAKRLLREVGRKGAAFGLHLILSTQSYQNVELEPDVKAQFRLRVGLQLSSSMECRALMGRDNDAPLTLARFTAVYNNNFGEARDNRQVALDPLERAELMRRLGELKARHPGTPRPVTAVGPKPADRHGSREDDFADWDELTS